MKFKLKSLIFLCLFFLVSIPSHSRPDKRIRVIEAKENLYILAVGINKYEDYSLTLTYAKADAQGFADAVERSRSGNNVTKLVLFDEMATREFIEAAFNQVIAKAKPHDTFVFHFAGMGSALKDNATDELGEFYLFPTDIDFKAKRSKGISTKLLETWSSKIQARNQLIVLDSCDSAQNFRTFASRVIGESRGLNDLLHKNVVILGTSGAAYESQELGHGQLTYALLQGLSGDADSVKDGHITAKELEAYFYGRYPQLMLELGSRSRPMSSSVGGDFTIGRTPNQNSATTVTATPKVETNTSNPAEPTRSRVAGVDTQKPNQPFIRKGKDYVLLIATDKYDELAELANPVADAHKVANDLKTYYGFETEIIENPTRSTIKSALHQYLTKKYADDDQLFIFIAGHGVYDEVLKQGYIAAKDSKRLDQFMDSYISHSDLRNIIDRISCKHILVALDVCFGGTFDTAKRSDDMYANVSKPELIARKMKYKTRLFLTSGGKEYVPDGRPGHNSPFARKLLEALRSYGGSDGILTFSKIYSYLEAIKPEPRKGEFGENEPGSDFLLIAKN